MQVCFLFFRIFAVHIDYGLTLTLGLGLLLKYVFVDRHNDLLEVKHVINLHKSLSQMEVETQTDDTVEEAGNDSILSSILSCMETPLLCRQ